MKRFSMVGQTVTVTLVALVAACSKQPEPAAPEAPVQTAPAPETKAAAPTPVEAAPAAPAPAPEPPKPVAAATLLAKGETVTVDGKANEPVWARAQAVEWDTDWAGKPSGVKTRARFAYDAEKSLHVLWELSGAAFKNSQKLPVKKEHTKLWQDDAVELFLGSPNFSSKHYYEIEVGPFGHFFDLEVDHDKPESDASRDNIPWSSGMKSAQVRDEAKGTAVIELSLTSADVAKLLVPGTRLPMGLYRLEGKDVAGAPDGRHYLAWSPTLTEKPAFHVPERFGTLELAQ